MAWSPTPSNVNTVSVPAQGGDPATLYRAADKPLRIAVRNTGGALLLLAHEANALQVDSPLAGTFRLPLGAESVFVLMPRQALLASANGAGGFASFAVSEAIPQLAMES